jgi:hypothetical protein
MPRTTRRLQGFFGSGSNDQAKLAPLQQERPADSWRFRRLLKFIKNQKHWLKCAKLNRLIARFPLTIPDMKSGPLVGSQALKFRCPTCGAGPKMKCELATGGARKQSHLDRRLIAVDNLGTTRDRASGLGQRVKSRTTRARRGGES